MWTRRKFIAKASLATGAMLAGTSLLERAEAAEEAVQRLIVLHTNDVHSRLEPFPMDGSRNQGLGGVVPRAELIRSIREEGVETLLLDSGDIFQGTPFFNFYKGEPEIKAMTAMGYDACTMGNHDFDAGLENFALQLNHARFPVLISNYDFSGGPMEFKYKPWQVFRKGRLKIGITGVGIEMQGLVPDNLIGSTRYLDPVQAANKAAFHLKKQEKCDMVICLSHLGYRYRDNKVSDEILARESEHIDLILGGHTHTFFDAPVVYKNKLGADVIVNQVGWAGIVLGRLEFAFQRNSKKNLEAAHAIIIEKKSGE